MLGSLILFGIGFTGFHEYGHWQVAQWVGVPGGRIELSLTSGFYFYPEGFLPTAIQDFWVGLGGGLAVAIFFSFFWFIRQQSLTFSAWDLDDTFALMVWGVGQLLYGFTEAVGWYWWGGVVPMVIGFVVGSLIYGRKIIKWLGES